MGRMPSHCGTSGEILWTVPLPRGRAREHHEGFQSYPLVPLPAGSARQLSAAPFLRRRFFGYAVRHVDCYLKPRNLNVGRLVLEQGQE